MYKAFFGLRENPFNVNPDPRFLFFTSQMQAALDELTYGLQAHKGLVLLTGEVGTGKTTLINKLLEILHKRSVPTAFIFNSHLEPRHLFDFILADFGVPHDPAREDGSLMRLNQWLIERYRSGGETPVLIVDEAQGLPLHVLEEIRMLLNLETPHQKLLQIVLAAQPELEERLRRPELRQLKQRITLRCKTAALTVEETHEYVQSRLCTAGAIGKAIFSREAIDALHLYSRGIPRVVNLLCEHGLILGYADNLKPIPARTIREIAREFQFDDVRPVGDHSAAHDMLTSKLIAMQPTLADSLAPPPVALSRSSVQGNAENNSNENNDRDAEVASASIRFSNDAGIDCVAQIVDNQATIALAPQLRVVDSKPKAAATAVADLRPLNPPAPENQLHCIATTASSEHYGWHRVRPSGSSLLRVIDIWKVKAKSIRHSVNLRQMNADLRTRLEVSQRLVRSCCQACAAWLNKRPASALTGHFKITSPVSRWLRQPWTLTMPAVPVSRFFSSRRKLAHK